MRGGWPAVGLYRKGIYSRAQAGGILKHSTTDHRANATFAVFDVVGGTPYVKTWKYSEQKQVHIPLQRVHTWRRTLWGGGGGGGTLFRAERVGYTI